MRSAGGRVFRMRQMVPLERRFVKTPVFCKLGDEEAVPRKEKVDKKAWGKHGLQAKLYSFILDHCRVSEDVRRLMDETENLPNSRQRAAVDQLPILAMLVRLTQSKHILDVGTFTGISALQFAMTIPEDGHVITIERQTEHLGLARKYWEEAGVQTKIELRTGEALDIIQQLDEEGYSRSIDFAFIDANKLGYDALYERLMKMIRPGALIVFDNMLWYGRVVDAECNDNITCAVRKLNKKLLQDERIEHALIPAGDGLVVCQVRSHAHLS